MKKIKILVKSRKIQSKLINDNGRIKVDELGLQKLFSIKTILKFLHKQYIFLTVTGSKLSHVE